MLSTVLALVSCGSLLPTPSDGDTTVPGAQQQTGAADNNDNKTTSADNNTPSGANPDMPEGVLAKRTSKSIEEVVGKTQTGKRIVRQVSESFLQMICGSWEHKPTAYYDVVTFDDDGFMSDSCIYYVFGNQGDFWAVFNNSAASYIDRWCREWNSDAYYYGFYSISAIHDTDGDEKISWDEAWADWNDPDDSNYILIQ